MPCLLIPETSLFRELEGECMLVNLEKEACFGLNETGTHIWCLLVDGVSTEEIPSSLVDAYDVTLKHATAAVETVVQELLAHGLAEADS